jgi:hypothetical protein
MGKATVVSLFPFEVNEEKPGVYPGRFLIAKSVKDEPQVLQISDGHTFYYDIDAKAIKVPILAESLAESIVYDFCSSFISYAPDAGPGLFWLEGVWTPNDVKTKAAEKLSSIRDRQIEWFRRICRLADDDWARYGVHKAISDLQRFAADYLGLDRPWSRKIEQLAMATCPACRQIIPSDALVCHLCRTIVKPQEYTKAGFKQIGA